MEWIKANKEPLPSGPEQKVLTDFLGNVAKITKDADQHDWLDQLGERVHAARDLTSGLEPLQASRATALLQVVSDLVKLGWKVKLDGTDIFVSRPNHESIEDLRRQMASRRRDQLATPSVVKFIENMESWRSYRGKQVSIFSVIRDGRDLAKALSSWREDQSGPAPVQPYVQAVDSSALCPQTGLLLRDIWRYFRHTWSNPYESIPGRSMQFLVRDRANDMHPVIGIFALSSSSVRLSGRDQFIGWDTGSLIAQIRENPSTRYANWLQKIITSALEEIYIEDLIEDELYIPDRDTKKIQPVIEELLRISEIEREKHFRIAEGKSGTKQAEDTDWPARAVEPLFRAKRMKELANLLSLRHEVSSFFEGSNPKEGLTKLVSSGHGRSLLERAIRIARSNTVGTHIADLTVCGSVAPYNHITGGKLVAALATSPETISLYNKRYEGASSIIASSMAGREITRQSKLCYIGTTSLYGKRPNQYDRIGYPAELVGGNPGQSIKYHFIRTRDNSGEKTSATKGIGSFHFSPETMRSLEQYCSGIKGGWRVNRIFGEGTSPKLRAIREGLDALGLDSQVLLTHGIGRCIYGVRLTTNLSEHLLGLNKHPAYICGFRSTDRATENIGLWWLERWALSRIGQERVMTEVATDTLIYPITHRARVHLQIDDSQGDLFDL